MKSANNQNAKNTISSEVVEKLLHERKAYDRLIKEAKTEQRYWRIREIYYGRYQRILRESDLL